MSRLMPRLAFAATLTACVIPQKYDSGGPDSAEECGQVIIDELQTQCKEAFVRCVNGNLCEGRGDKDCNAGLTHCVQFSASSPEMLCAYANTYNNCEGHLPDTFSYPDCVTDADFFDCPQQNPKKSVWRKSEI